MYNLSQELFEVRAMEWWFNWELNSMQMTLHRVFSEPFLQQIYAEKKSYVSELKQVCRSRTLTLEAQTNSGIHFPGMSITLKRKDPL